MLKANCLQMPYACYVRIDIDEILHIDINALYVLTSYIMRFASSPK